MFTRIAKMVLLCWIKWLLELKTEKKNLKGQWPGFKIISHCPLWLFTTIAKMGPLGWTKWPPELKIDKKQALPSLLSLLVLHMVFPSWRITWFSFPASALHGLFFLLLFHKFPISKYCDNHQTKWSPLINISQSMTLLLPQAIFLVMPLCKKKCNVIL